MAQLPTPQRAQQADTAITDRTPLSIIRTETVLSRLPIHHLSKKGRVHIQITKKNEHGAIELR